MVGDRLLNLSKDTLLLIPCSGGKSSGSVPCERVSILNRLSPSISNGLSAARATLRDKAQVDERTLVPAFRRYSGQLYANGSSAIGAALNLGCRVMIVSGGYGLLLANEPIGMYERRFTLSDWPRGLLETCLMEYSRSEEIAQVIAVMSATTDYGKLIRRTKKNWAESGMHAMLVSPVSVGGGAMIKVPRAQGQAIAALVDGAIGNDWRSTDGLRLEVENLGV